MKVVLAEKPSVAREIAKYLDASSAAKGFYRNHEWAVTWAFGHMVELQEPEDYTPQWKPWRQNSLPIIPQHFKLRARGDASAYEQLMVIKALFEAGRRNRLRYRCRPRG